MRQVQRALVLGLLLALWSPAAQAVPAWYLAEVVAGGVADTGSVLVRLTDTAGSPAFTKKWFIASGGVKKEMLATFLTALSVNLDVWIRADLAAASVPSITRMYLQQ